jgi:cysteine desulfurase
MADRVYLDWNATTPLRPEARQAMQAAWQLPGNPSSVHAEGRQARRLVEEARTTVAEAVGGQPRNVVFTSGGTEANALALSPGPRRATGLPPVQRLLVSAIEHASVLAGGRFPPEAIATIGVTRCGLLDFDRLRAALEDGPPALVSVMLANNETGAIQPVAEAAEIVHASGCLLHVDAIQAFGKIPMDINAIGADLVTLSEHKIGGPKGVGAVILAEGVSGLDPQLRGGGQEFGRRAGTENVAGIAGFGAAAKSAMVALEKHAIRLESLRKRLESGLRQTQGVIIFSEHVARLPNTTLFTVPGLRAETAVIGFGAVRLSLGWSTSEADIDRCLEAWRKLAGTLPKRSDETLLERF